MVPTIVARASRQSAVLVEAHTDVGRGECPVDEDELGAFFDHLRRVGIQGFVTEHVHPDPIADEVTIDLAKR